MAKSKYETKACRCGYRVFVEWAYCPYEQMGVLVAFYDANEFPEWSLPVNNCPGCGAELVEDELENV